MTSREPTAVERYAIAYAAGAVREGDVSNEGQAVAEVLMQYLMRTGPKDDAPGVSLGLLRLIAAVAMLWAAGFLIWRAL